MTTYAHKITIDNIITIIIMHNIETHECGISTKDATSCETSSIFYCPKVNNTRHNKYNNSPVEGICDE